MCPDPDPDAKPLFPDQTKVIESDERIDTADFKADYPPVPGERGHYVDGKPLMPTPGRQMPVRVGSVVDGYRVVRQIGRGGMGVVYEAEQVSLARKVALKVLPPALLKDARAIKRFQSEAAAVARLSHPRIVSVYGFDVNQEGVAYLSMEFVEGIDMAVVVDRLKTAQTHGRRFVRISGANLDQDISEWAKGNKLMGTQPGDPRIGEGIVLDLRSYDRMAAALIADAADALRHAHAHDVIHRDIKPSNLIVSDDGRIKLTDFGLAKTDVGGAASLTETGDFVGSPAYVSPEQAATRRTRPDARSDLFSLGVTLYELLTLHQPFVGKNVAVILRNIITKEPPLPTRINPRIPRDLETIVLKAMEKDPDRRFQSAEEFGEELRRFINYEPILSRPIGPLLRGWRFVQRNAMAVGSAVLAVALATLVTLVLAGVFSGASGGVAETLRITLAARGGGDSRSEGLLELVALLAREGQTGPERRARIEALVSEARGLLARGEYPGLVDLIGNLDALTLLGDEAELDQMLPVEIRSVKVDLVRRLRGEVLKSDIGAAPRRGFLAHVETLLADRDWIVARNAIAALRDAAEPSSLGALLDALSQCTDARVRRALLEALAGFGGNEVLAAVSGDLLHEDPFVRYAALEALERLAPADLAARVRPLVADTAPWVAARTQGLLRTLRGRAEDGGDG